MSFYMFADAAPSEAIQPHDLPGIAIACLLIHQDGVPVLDVPISKQFKDWNNPNTRDVAANDLAHWLSEKRKDGLTIAGFSIARTKEAAARFGLDLIEELPDTHVEEHYGKYRLYFGEHHVSFAQAVALVYYNLPLNMGLLRAATKIRRGDRKILVLMDRFPATSSGKLQPGERSEMTPGMYFMRFLRSETATGIGIEENNREMGLEYEMSTLDWWRYDAKDPEEKPGKEHPHFTLVDWFVAASLAHEFPDEFVSDYPRAAKAVAVKDALCNLYSEFKKFDILTIADDNTLDRFRANPGEKKWTVPGEAREFILNLAEVRN